MACVPADVYFTSEANSVTVLKIALAAMKAHSSQPAVLQACSQLIHKLSGNGKVKRKVVTSGGIAAFVQGVRDCAPIAAVVEAGITALIDYADQDETVALICEADGVAAIAACIASHCSDAAIVDQSLKLVSMLVETDGA